MKKILLAALTILIPFSTMAQQMTIKNECALRAGMFSDILELHNDPVKQCSKIQVKQYIHEVATGGTQTLNNCITQQRYKIPVNIDGKRYEVWADSVVENVWSDSQKAPGNFKDYLEACINNPDKFINGPWLFKYSLAGYADFK
ncbi:hypothetical protein EcCFBP13530_23695 [Enterobacter cancerogenus]|uniref:Uncharacterized protein n=1 Tax=Enterobacter cancerogenus TaxID=69218 RepID=A0AB38NY93_9ENTR|nr:hypothetical protein [Enterobacter cancerogenus]TKK12445.1 hypothetical protein EcCFBP13530_23695 [Enterobacter cancerogenus]